jgi:hypothetical protein
VRVAALVGVVGNARQILAGHEHLHRFRLRLLGRDPLGLLLPLGRIQPLLPGGQGGPVPFRIDLHIDVGADGGRERRRQPVVVGLGQGIELVVVAAGAADRDAEHRRPAGGHHVVELGGAGGLELLLGELRGEGTGREETGGLQRLDVARCQFVAGNLPLEERVVRQVVVEGPDDEVAVVVGERPVVVLFVAEALGEPGDVEPVLRPTFAEGGPRQQVVHDPPVGRIGRVGDEGRDLRRCRGQTGDVEGEPAPERLRIGLWRGHQADPLLGGEDEPVDRVPAPAPWVRRPGRLDRCEGTERPELPRLRPHLPVGPRAAVGGVDERPVEGRAAIDPFGEPAELFGVQRIPLLGHVRLLQPGRQPVHPALRRLARHDGRPAAPPGEQFLSGRDVELPLDASRAMAARAAVGEEFSEVRPEDLEPARIGDVGRAGRGRGPQARAGDGRRHRSR